MYLRFVLPFECGHIVMFYRYISYLEREKEKETNRQRQNEKKVRQDIIQSITKHKKN